MIGIDLTTISRFKNKSETFIKTVLSKDEILEYEASESKEYFLAARWAIKEALFKSDNSLFPFNKISITKENGQYIFKDYIISTTSENDSYIAIVRKAA